MTIIVIKSNMFKLGQNGVINHGILTIKSIDNKTVRYSLDQLTYLKPLNTTDHKPTIPSLTAATQSFGATVLSVGLLSSGNIIGGLTSFLIGHNIAQKTNERHYNKIAKTTYQIQVTFDENTTAILQIDNQEYKQLAKYFEWFSLI